MINKIIFAKASAAKLKEKTQVIEQTL